MGKVINLSSYKLSKAKQGQCGYIQYEAIQKCIDFLYVQTGVLGEVSLYAEEILREQSLDPAEFMLSEKSSVDYMALNFMNFVSGAEDIYIDFEALRPDGNYTLEITATCKDEETIEFDALLFRKSSNGSELFDIDTNCWCSCPD